MHPWLVRRVTYPVWEWRHGRKVLATLHRLDRTQWLSSEEMEALQVTGLKSILAHAYEHSRHYREAFRAKGITPRDVRSLADLRFLPILERVVLRDRLADVMTRPRTEGLIKRQTSGSTDDAVVVWADPETDSAWSAAAFRFMRWWNVDVGDRRLIMLSRHRISRSGWLKQYHFSNILEYPAASLSEAMLSEICVWIRRGGIRALWGYPSALVRLADMMSTGPSARVQVIFSTGEILHTDQRALLARSFQCAVVEAYGASETGYIAGECPEGRLHIFSENVLLEAETSADGDLPGALLITDLTNFVTPLIRYRIGDLGIIGGVCTCGRSLPVLIGGAKRISDQIILPDGRSLDPQMLSRVIEETTASTRLHQHQVIQHAPSDFEILLAVGTAPPASVADEVKTRFLEALQVPVHVSVRFVHQITTDRTGKQPRFVQRAGSASARG